MRNGGIFATFILIAVIFGGFSFYTTQATQERLTATAIRDGERACSGSSDSFTCKYIEYFDKETFENTGNFWVGKFNSSDVHGKIREGVTCDLVVSGYRVPFLSMHRNILEAKCH